MLDTASGHGAHLDHEASTRTQSSDSSPDMGNDFSHRYNGFAEPSCTSASRRNSHEHAASMNFTGTAQSAGPALQGNGSTEETSFGYTDPPSIASWSTEGIYPACCHSCGALIDATNESYRPIPPSVPSNGEPSSTLLRALPGLSWSPAETTTEPATPELGWTSADLDFSSVIEGPLWTHNSFPGDFELFGPQVNALEEVDMRFAQAMDEQQGGEKEVLRPLASSSQSLLQPPAAAAAASTRNPSGRASPARKRRFQCPHGHCPGTFTSKNDLERHLGTRKHRKDGSSLERSNRFTCPIQWCKRKADGFGRRDHFLRHLHTMHPDLKLEDRIGQGHDQSGQA